MSRGLRLQDTAFLGRVGNAGVTPLSFPGLWRWYKADEYSPFASDGQSVGGGGSTWGPWTDQTGSGDNATGSVIFKTNQVGTQPILRFSNVALTFAPGVLGDFTILYLAKTTAGATSFLFNDPFGSTHQVRQLAGGAHVPVFYAGGAVISGDTFPGNTFDVCEVKRAGSTITFRQNQVARNGGTEGTPLIVTQIGNSSGAGQTADVGEILIYNVALSTTNVDLLYTQYLKPKWVLLP